MEDKDETIDKKKRIIFIFLGILLGFLLFSSFFLFDYLFYFDPELEGPLFLLLFIILSGFISGLVPLEIVDGIISGALFSVFLYIVWILRQVFYFIKLGILIEVWEPKILVAVLRLFMFAFCGSIIGVILRFLIEFFIKILRKKKIK